MDPILSPDTPVQRLGIHILPPLEGSSTSRYIQGDLLGIRIARYLSNRENRPFYAVVGEFEGFDVSSLDESYRVEVKTESTPIRTGNVAIEYWNTELDKPSGILATTANRWWHIVPEGDAWMAYELDTAVLRRLVISEGISKSNNRNSICKLIPLATIREQAMAMIPIPRAVMEGRAS